MKIDLSRRAHNSAKYTEGRLGCPDRYEEYPKSFCENLERPEDEDNCIIICDCYQCPKGVIPESD